MHPAQVAFRDGDPVREESVAMDTLLLSCSRSIVERKIIFQSVIKIKQMKRMSKYS